MESTNGKTPRVGALEALKVQTSKLAKNMVAQKLNGKHLDEYFLMLLWAAVAFACLHSLMLLAQILAVVL